MIGNVSFRLTEKRKQEIYDTGTQTEDVNRTYGSTAITRFSTMTIRCFPILVKSSYDDPLRSYMIHLKSNFRSKYFNDEWK